MNDVKNVEQKKSKIWKVFKMLITSKIGGIIGILLLGAILGIGASKFISFQNKTTKIGFEDIGELATQAAYCTKIQLTDASRELFGVSIPFTQSKYIYSYDVVIKAGVNFEEVELKEKNGNTLEVKLPEVKILSSEVKWDSFQLYHEQESIFRQITMEENNEAMENLVKNAEKDAVANGLLDNARENAELMLTGFLAEAYDLDKYEIKFVDK